MPRLETGILLSVLTAASLYAATVNNAAKELYFNDANAFVIDENGTRKSMKTESNQRILDSFVREVAYEKIKKDMHFRNIKYQAAKEDSAMVFDTSGYQQKLADRERAEAKAAARAKKEEKKKRRYIHLTGYCQVADDVEVSLIKSYAYVNCEFSSRRVQRGRLMISLTPMPNAQALIGTPVYVDTGGYESDKMVYRVDRGAVMTMDRTSINIANFFNDVLAKRAITEGVMATGEIAAQQTMAYLEDERQSRIRSEVNYVTGGGVGTPAQPVFTQNQRKPDPELYLVAAGVQIASALVNVVGQAFLDDIHYMFKIYKGAQLYVDMVVHEENDETMMEDYEDNGKIPRVEPIQETRGFAAVPTSGGRSVGGRYSPTGTTTRPASRATINIPTGQRTPTTVNFK